MEKITNEKYKAFLQGEMMQTIPREEFVAKLDTIRYRNGKQLRIFAILLWMTAARPNEVLRLQAKDITKDERYLKIKLKGSKGGYEDAVPLPIKDELVKEVWEYVQDMFGELFVFWQLQSKSKRNGTTRSFYKKNSDGTLERKTKTYTRQYDHLSNKLHRQFVKYFGVPPYYFRHNRMTVAAEKLNEKELKMLKRSKTVQSVWKYVHMTSKTGQRISKELIK